MRTETASQRRAIRTGLSDAEVLELVRIQARLDMTSAIVCPIGATQEQLVRVLMEKERAEYA